MVQLSPDALQRLESEYQRVIRAESEAFSRGKDAIKQYVEDLEAQAKKASPQQEPPPKKDIGESPSPDGSKV
jgi:hypothetical protein